MLEGRKIEDEDIKKVYSPNYNDKDKTGRETFITPKAIVIHWTAGYYKSSMDWLCNPISQVSAHFVIDRTGNNISHLVALNKRAWHCGGSFHPLHLKDTNADTIGIECEGPPSLFKETKWNESFINVLVELCKYIESKVPTIVGIVDHSTIMPKRKSDVKGGTGVDLFPWEEFVKRTGLEDYTVEPYRTEIKKYFGMPV